MTQACEVLGISRQSYYEARKPQLELVHGGAPKPPQQQAAGVARIKAAITEIVDAHRAWGVRKVWAVLRRAPYLIKIGARRVWALMRSMGLCLPADHVNREPQPRGHVAVEQPNRRLATDLTTVWTRDDGLVAVIPVVDCGCRTLHDVHVTKSQESAAVLLPVRSVLVEIFGSPENVPADLELRTDHGPQYTGVDCEELCLEWHVDHTLAPVGRPTGNAVAERVIRTMKEECIWLRDWTSAAELQEALSTWRRVYNEERPHQALKWQTPSERRAERLTSTRMAA